jgi:uncharacterized membrane protein YfcA
MIRFRAFALMGIGSLIFISAGAFLHVVSPVDLLEAVTFMAICALGARLFTKGVVAWSSPLENP